MTAVPPETVDLSKYIETRLMGDRPHIRNRRIPVTYIARDRVAHNWRMNTACLNRRCSQPCCTIRNIRLPLMSRMNRNDRHGINSISKFRPVWVFRCLLHKSVDTGIIESALN